MAQNTSAQRQKSGVSSADPCALHIHPQGRSGRVYKFFTERQAIRRRRWFFCCMDFRLRRSCIAS